MLWNNYVHPRWSVHIVDVCYVMMGVGRHGMGLLVVLGFGRIVPFFAVRLYSISMRTKTMNILCIFYFLEQSYTVFYYWSGVYNFNFIDDSIFQRSWSIQLALHGLPVSTVRGHVVYTISLPRGPFRTDHKRENFTVR